VPGPLGEGVGTAVAEVRLGRVAPLAEAPPRVDGPSGEVLVELGDPTFVTWYAVVERLG
jgi:hypothetical protein